MTYLRERDEFIAKATREGLDLPTIHKLLRYATTLQRLAAAQCNGDWPYNGDRDRPLPRTEHTERWDRQYTACPRCEASGVSKSSMRMSSEIHDKVCQDCRTQELVNAVLSQFDVRAIFGGDPRGAVLVLSTPNFPYTDDGHSRGLYVPPSRRY